MVLANTTFFFAYHNQAFIKHFLHCNLVVCLNPVVKMCQKQKQSYAHAVRLKREREKKKTSFDFRVMQTMGDSRTVTVLTLPFKSLKSEGFIYLFF